MTTVLDDTELYFDRTNLTKESIMKLVEICFNGQLYRQMSGLPMGSPISVVLSEFTRQEIEKLTFLNPPTRPVFWIRLCRRLSCNNT